MHYKRTSPITDGWRMRGTGLVYVRLEVLCLTVCNLALHTYIRSHVSLDYTINSLFIFCIYIVVGRHLVASLKWPCTLNPKRLPTVLMTMIS